MKNTKIEYFVFNGFGNYSDCHGWDDGLTISENFTKHSSAEVELMDDVHKLPEMGNLVELYANSYGGSRNATILVAAESAKIAMKIAIRYASAYSITEYAEPVEYIVASDPNGGLAIFESPATFMGSRWDYVTAFKEESDAVDYIEERK